MPPKKGAVPIAKRQKVADEFDLENESQSKPKPKPKPKQKASKKLALDDKETLFEKIATGKTSLATYADNLVDIYQKNEKAVVLELVQLISQACNCKAIPEEDRMGDEAADVLTEMVGKMPPESGDYALASPDKKWKAFRTRYPEFWRVFIQRANRQPLWDQSFMELTKDWITTMSTSNVRSFRHTATVAIYSMIDGFINVGKQLHHDLEIASIEKKKKRKGASQDTESQAIHSKIITIEENINHLFESTFILRYRDKVTDIRVLSMNYLSEWLKSYPSFFVRDHVTKYIGWSLNDKEYQVREIALRALQNAYTADESSPSKMENFANRFLKRMIEMTRDVKSNVGVEAVKIIGTLFTVDLTGTLIKNEDIENTLAKMFDPWPSIRLESARFFKKFLRHEFPVDDDADETTKQEINRKKLKLVLDFMDCYNFSEVSRYLVDAMWEVGVGFLHDWEIIMDELMEQLRNEDKSDQESNKDRHMLGMVHSVLLRLKDKLVLPSDKDSGHIRRQSKLTAQQKQFGLKTMSEQLVNILPDLITSFRSNPEQVIWLCEIIQNMDLNVYVEKGLDKQFQHILDELSRLFLDYSRDDVLMSIAQTWNVLSTNDFPMKSAVEKKFIGIIKELESSLHQLRREHLSQVDEADHSLTVVWQRIRALYSFNNLNVNFWETVLNSLISSDDVHPTPPTALPYIALCAFVGLLRKINIIIQGQSVGEEVTIREDIDLLMRRMISLLKAPTIEVKYKIKLLQTVCDISYMLNSNNKAPKSIHYTLKDADLTILVDVWDALLSDGHKHFKSKEERNERAYEIQKSTIALCRVTPHDSSVCPRIMRKYIGPKELHEPIKYHRTKVWRLQQPSEAWKLEWKTLRLQFENYLDSHGEQEELELKDFISLCNLFSREHSPQFSHYQALFKGSIFKILASSIEYVKEDVQLRYKFLSGMFYYCYKVSIMEAKELFRQLETIIHKDDLDTLGKECHDDLNRFANGLKRSAGILKKAEETTGPKVTGKRKAPPTSQEENDDSNKVDPIEEDNEDDHEENPNEMFDDPNGDIDNTRRRLALDSPEKDNTSVRTTGWRARAQEKLQTTSTPNSSAKKQQTRGHSKSPQVKSAEKKNEDSTQEDNLLSQSGLSELADGEEHDIIFSQPSQEITSVRQLRQRKK